MGSLKNKTYSDFIDGIIRKEKSNRNCNFIERKKTESVS